MKQLRILPWRILSTGVLVAAAIAGAWGCSCIIGTCENVTPESWLAEGVEEEWVAHYEGGGAQAIALDSNGNICIAGPGSVIKYNSAGQKLWDAHLSSTSGISIAIDAIDNIYILGLGGGEFPEFPAAFYLEKYSADGEDLWSGSHAADNYYGASLILDGQGNAYVAADMGWYVNNTICIFKYSGIDGSELSMISYYNSTNGPENPCVAIDGSDNLYVGGANKLVKYDSNGAVLWTKTEIGHVNCLALDSQGNIIINTNYHIVKYSSSGIQLWQINYDSPYAGIVPDGSGNFYAVGGGHIIKYSTDGTQLWSIVRNGLLTVDSAGSIYVTGVDDKWWFTNTYNSNGVVLWGARYWDGAEEFVGDIWSTPTGIAVDASGNVYVTGRSTYQVCGGGLAHIDSGSLASAEFTTIKYSGQPLPTGIPLATLTPSPTATPPPIYTLTIIYASPGGFTIPREGTYQYTHGSLVEIYVYGNGWAGWSGDASGDLSPLRFHMYSNKTIYANWIEQ